MGHGHEAVTGASGMEHGDSIPVTLKMPDYMPWGSKYTLLLPPSTASTLGPMIHPHFAGEGLGAQRG